MSPPDVRRAITEAEIGREIIRLVPDWYEAAHGPEQHAFTVGEHTATFYHHRGVSQNLLFFLDRVRTITGDLPLHQFIQFPSLNDVLLETLAVEWLSIHSSKTDWFQLLKYLDAVARRTCENEPISLNLIIRDGEGKAAITEPALQKFLDRLASSSFSYVAVDHELRLLDYGEVVWEDIKSIASRKFHPEFLHPIHSVMQETDISAHLTAQGDVIIMSKAGVLAVRRQRQWKIYDADMFQNSLAQCMGHRDISGNLVDIIFDLSFRRHGALLIYDPNHCIAGHVLNSESVIAPDDPSVAEVESPKCGQKFIMKLLEETSVEKQIDLFARKRRLIEMATIDGALVFDNERLLAIGALIRSHPSVGNQLGARTTAARSAYLWGAHPIKVSSDGDVIVYFRSENNSDGCDAEMSFL
jgi:hypothetical protein